MMDEAGEEKTEEAMPDARGGADSEDHNGNRRHAGGFPVTAARDEIESSSLRETDEEQEFVSRREKGGSLPQGDLRHPTGRDPGGRFGILLTCSTLVARRRMHID